MAIWGESRSVRNVEVRNMEIEGGYDCDGNWSPLRVEDVDGVHVHHSLFHNLVVPPHCALSSSASLVKVFHGKNLLMEYNTFDAVGSVGLKLIVNDKDSPNQNTHRFNHYKAANSSQMIELGNSNTIPTADLFFYGRVDMGLGCAPSSIPTTFRSTTTRSSTPGASSSATRTIRPGSRTCGSRTT